jgi:hypothetical protein
MGASKLSLLAPCPTRPAVTTSLCATSAHPASCTRPLYPTPTVPTPNSSTHSPECNSWSSTTGCAIPLPAASPRTCSKSWMIAMADLPLWSLLKCLSQSGMPASPILLSAMPSWTAWSTTPTGSISRGNPGAKPMPPCPCRPLECIMCTLASLRSAGWTTCPELVDDFIGIRTNKSRTR